MRMLEMGSLMLHVIWFIHMIFFRWRKGKFLLLSVSSAVMAMQLLFEGYRFHIVPIYLLFVILAGLTLKGTKNEAGSKKTVMIRKVLAAVFLIPYLAVCVLLPYVFPVFSYSKPTGTYSIGTTVYDLNDSSRDESFSEARNDKRKLAIQVWYPAAAKEGGKKSKWLTHPDAVAKGMESVTKVPSYFFDNLKYIDTYGVENAPVASQKSSYPVILFSHGFGSGFRSQSLFQVQELASRGYIVVTIDHTYFSLSTLFTDGSSVQFNSDVGWPTLINDKSRKVADIWVEDARFVLDQLETMNVSDPHSILTNKMDLSKVGYLGASFGGPVAARAMQLDDRIKAGINQDARPFYHEEIVQEGLQQPFMYMQSSNNISNASNAQLKEFGVTREQWNGIPQEIELELDRFFQSLKGNGYLMKIKGTEHVTFSDMYLLIRMPFSKNTEIHRAHQIINDYTLAFFNKHLLGEETPLLKGLTKYPEVFGFRAK